MRNTPEYNRAYYLAHRAEQTAQRLERALAANFDAGAVLATLDFSSAPGKTSRLWMREDAQLFLRKLDRRSRSKGRVFRCISAVGVGEPPTFRLVFDKANLPSGDTAEVLDAVARLWGLGRVHIAPVDLTEGWRATAEAMLADMPPASGPGHNSVSWKGWGLRRA